MEELQLTLTPSRVDQRNQGIMLANWRVGQTINALVSERMPNGGVLLNVGPHSFATSRDIPVQPGSRILLEVQQIEPKLVLRLLTHPKSADAYRTPGMSFDGAPIDVGKVEAKSLSSVFKNLEMSLQSRSISLVQFTSELKAQLGSNFLLPGAINANSLQTALVLSGIFTEALWLSNRPSLGARSTKTILMILRQRVLAALEKSSLTSTERAALSRLFSSIDSSITSITHQQISSLPQDSERPKWLATLPLQLDDEICEIDVEIERRPRQQSEDTDGWRLKFSLTLNTLGPITVLLEMQNGRLRIDFKVSASINGPLNESLPLLRNRLIASGLEPDQLSSSSYKARTDGEHEPPQTSLNISI